MDFPTLSWLLLSGRDGPIGMVERKETLPRHGWLEEAASKHREHGAAGHTLCLEHTLEPKGDKAKRDL